MQKGTLRSYLAAVARNAGIKRLKKRREHVPIDDIEVSDPGDFAKESSYHDFVWNAVMSLGEPDHEIFVRRYKFDEKLRDIAKAMGLNVSTVRTRLSRGKRKLRKILSDAEEKQ